jgi:hypothetical protein
VRELVRVGPGNRTLSGPVRTIAREQEGIVSRAQLLVAGVSRSAIHRAVRSGTLHRVHPGVYAAMAPELLTEDARIVAALLAAATAPCSATGRRPGAGASFPLLPR